MNDLYMTPMEQRPYNLMDALVGVIVRPVAAMQAIADARPWRTALVVLIVIAVLSALVSLITPLQPTPVPLDPDMPSGFANMLRLSQSRLPVIAGVLLGPLFQGAYAGILFLLARLLGGQGHYSAVFSTTIFSSVPSIFLLPVTLAVNLSGVLALTFISAPLAFAFTVWGLVLQVIGVRAAMRLSTGRAAVTVLIPLGIIMFLACVLVVLIVGLTIIGIRSTMPEFPMP